MTDPTELDVTRGYSRQEVEVYLREVETQRAELEAAIEAARARATHASELERRIVALEQRVGQWIVEAHVQASRRPETSQVFTDPPGAVAPTAPTTLLPATGVGSESTSSADPGWNPRPSTAPSGWEAEGA
jgi:hypothetical protein